MHPQNCNVCFHSTPKEVWHSEGEYSITSLCEIINHKTQVFYCTNCGHIQTSKLSNEEYFYSSEYRISINIEEEDQLYEINSNGEPVYRTEHQLSLLLKNLVLPKYARILDYGCAKGATLRHLYKIRPDLGLFAYDVSDMYRSFWDDFLSRSNQATFSLPEEWIQSFDLVTSFFSLEHAGKPRQFLSQIKKLLRRGGIFFCIVPNPFTNYADMLVADHPNHFSESSLRFLFNASGFKVETLDDSLFRGAWVLTASLLNGEVYNSPLTIDIKSEPSVLALVKYWNDYVARVRLSEESAKTRKASIYGSGFYGTFLASCLRDVASVEYFLDNSPFRQKQKLLGKSIISPRLLPNEEYHIYVGLNPKNAHETISVISEWKSRPYSYFLP